MNKALIVVLAVCLVSVHAFVKRDAEKPAEKTTLEEMKENADKMLKETSEKLKGFFESDAVKESLDPEKMKKKLEEAMDTVKKLFDTNAVTAEKKE